MNASIKKAQKLGYVITDDSHGVITMVKTSKSGGMEFLNIDKETGEFYGQNRI